MSEKGKRQFVIYSRKSRFTGKGESIENQIEICRKYIGSFYSQEEADRALVFEDEGFSGGTLERPQFQKMMAASRSLAFYAIVVYRLDRISRNIGDFSRLIDDLGKRGIGFISVKEQFDTESPMGRAMMYISSVFSQLERETIAERIRDNMHELAKSGRWLGGNTPTGYASEGVTNVTLEGKSRKAFRLRPIPEELNLVGLIFEKFLEWGSLTRVDQYLLEKRLQTKRGNDFTRFAIRGILTNPVYMIADAEAWAYFQNQGADVFGARDTFDGSHGIMAYNRTLQRQGQAAQLRPIQEWIVAVGKHPGVISGAEWIRVQEMLAGNRSKHRRRPRSNVALLSGLLVCGGCGDYMRPKLTNRVNAAGERQYTYLCTTKERSGKCLCQMKNVNGNALDGAMLEQLQQLPEDWSQFTRLLGQGRKSIRSGGEGGGELALVRSQAAENENAIRALSGALTRAAGMAAEQVILARMNELQELGEELRRRMAELEQQTHLELAEQDRKGIQRQMSDFHTCVGEAPVEEKRRILKALVKQVVWDGETAHVTLAAAQEPEIQPPADAQMVPLGEDSK